MGKIAPKRNGVVFSPQEPADFEKLTTNLGLHYNAEEDGTLSIVASEHVLRAFLLRVAIWWLLAPKLSLRWMAQF